MPAYNSTGQAWVSFQGEGTHGWGKTASSPHHYIFFCCNVKAHPESGLKTRNCCEVIGLLTPTHVLLFALLCKSSNLMLISEMNIKKKKRGLIETGVSYYYILHGDSHMHLWCSIFTLIIKPSFCRCVQNGYLAFLSQDATALYTTPLYFLWLNCFSLLCVHYPHLTGSWQCPSE